MNEELKKWLERAKTEKKANKKWLTNQKNNKKLDPLFHEQHERMFEKVDCLDCANCCKTTSPIFRDVDINRIAQHLRIKPSLFTEKHLHIDEDGDWVLNQSPCLFLGADNKCSIYEHRPKACREYPHTDRKNMAQILDLTYRNTLVCPAVAKMVQNIQQNTAFNT
jgi:Fe-S-cluster containining protein